MTFWEFSAVCDGFESFHAAPEEESAADRAPSPEEYWQFLGLEPPEGY